MSVTTLGISSPVVTPDYALSFYTGGDPTKKLLKGLDLRSVTSIQTSKTIDDISGTWSITFRDGGGAMQNVSEMDTCMIGLRNEGPAQTVMRGVVDEVSAIGSASPAGADDSVTVQGRCMAKYCQITSTFLPVFDPNSGLPTALMFGYGDFQNKTDGSNTPRTIWGYLYNHFLVGQRNLVGVSGVPNARYWLTYNGDPVQKLPSRFRDIPGFTIPFIEFDETDLGTALQQFAVTGFTEAWVDELGQVVYRQPQWDAPVNYYLPTSRIKSWEFDSSDVDMYTYVEVVPTGNPGLSSQLAQASLTGRAPVPSSYAAPIAALTNQSGAPAGLGGAPSSEFVIDTDSSGYVTSKGQQNYWYKLQRKYGLRPNQITSPLITSLPQAQAQAEGLLRFMSRFQKTATVTIPGDPRVRLGTNVRIYGLQNGVQIDRTYYIEGVQHSYVEGDTYDTTLQLSHGRDPWDPKWAQIAIPKGISASGLATAPAVAAANDTAYVTPSGSSAAGGSGGGAGGGPTLPANAPAAVQQMVSEGNAIAGYPYAWGGGHPTIGQASSGTTSSAGGAVVTGFDCSGTVSAVLWAAGLLTASEVASEFMTYGDAGQGQWVTIYASQDHTFMNIGGSWFGTGRLGVGGGPDWGNHDNPANYVARHPPGL